MGLDWNPLAKPKPGHEAEFRAMFPKLAEPDDAVVARFHLITDPPYVTVGAPQVGVDEAANAWLRARLEETGKLDKLDEALREMHGYRVLALLPPCDGFPFYSNHGAYGDLERYSFRGQFLKDVEAILGPELFQRAYERQNAPDTRQYGKAILQRAESFARERNVTHAGERFESDFDESTDAHRAHVMFAAGRWCVFWGDRGHGLDPWF